MNWKFKSRIIALIERAPMSGQVYYFLQRFITRTIPRPFSSIEQVIRHERRHLDSYFRFTSEKIPKEVFEFGAGWDLCGSLVRHKLGVNSQRIVDLFPLASAWQINHVINYLATHDTLGTGSINLPVNDVWSDLLSKTGISYAAPCDAAFTNYKDKSIDLITSTNTLEHIPPLDIKKILAECRRILSPDGIMSMKIDYSDHYSHSDATIGPYNFLQFSEKEWAQHNHVHHYQNRLRHSDYSKMFSAAGFKILHEEWTALPEDSILPPLDDSFKHYLPTDLMRTEGYFVLT